MDLFNEIDDLSDLFLLEKNTKLDSPVEGYDDLQSRYSSLHEDYAKEIENSKKVGKCLVKCLKFYSKLCKKYEAQQKTMKSLEETIKEKMISLEEAQRNEEKMKGLIQVYRSERAFYVGQTNSDLRKDKEILLDICCRLIGESVKNNNIRNLTNLLLRKFKKDLDDEKINLLKRKNVKFKNESECDVFEDVKSNLIGNLKNEISLKTEEEKYSEQMSEECAVEADTKNDPLDLSMCRAASESKQCPEENGGTWAGDEASAPEGLRSVPGSPEDEEHVEETAEKSAEGSLSAEMEGGDGKVTENRLESATCSGSIFDVSGDAAPSADGLKEETKEGEVCPEIEFGGWLFERKEEVGDEGQLGKDADVVSVELRDSCEEAEEEEEEEEEELNRILREMSGVRLPSPVREIGDSSVDVGSGGCNLSKGEVGRKRVGSWGGGEVGSGKSKKLKGPEGGGSGGLLESIMSAMSLQNEEFKWKGLGAGDSEVGAEGCKFSRLGTRTYSRRKKLEGQENSSSVLRQSPRTMVNRQRALESLVMEEIKSFVSSPISCKEDADKNVKHCLSVLSSKSEEVIAKCIVATVLENVDEVVESFERPAPPLTKTQHRLIVLLSVLRTVDSSSEKISSSILSLISEKLFPDNFFWPDDSVESASRFYAALCRARNEPKILWKFCLQSMTDMRQRCPLLVFTVLKTWPDVLHDATTLKNNTLALTLVNLFLHMPKTEGLRNFNQGRKLVALKHLLMNFYQFKVDDTIEGYARKLVEAVAGQEVGADKSVVLLCRCRDAGWTMKHVLPALKSILSDWCEGKAEDVAAAKVLSVMKQICPVLVQESTDEAKIRDLVHCLSQILTCGKKDHESEVSTVEVLLQLKQYPEARKMIREWIPKSPISEWLRNEIINASAENILRELRLNKKREAKSLAPHTRRLKKHSKKSKGKKKKGKKRKKNEESLGVSS